jgi:hypothetical protein
MAAVSLDWRKWSRFGVLVFLCMSGAAGASSNGAAIEEGSIGEQAVYREALYHYFLRDHARAFSVLGRDTDGVSPAGRLASDGPNKESMSVKPSSRRIESLKAVLAIAYGMHDLAGGLLDNMSEDAQLRDMASYHLALLAYQQGQPEKARGHLVKITSTPQHLMGTSDLTLLRADIALQLAQPVVAATLLEQLPVGSRDYLLTALNIANYYSRHGRYGLARDFYQKIDAAAGINDSSLKGWLSGWFDGWLQWPRKGFARQGGTSSARAVNAARAHGDGVFSVDAARQARQRLIQRARLAAGYAALEAGFASEAEQWLETVSQQSAGARQAILGYGWSLYQRGEFSLALGAWQTLSTATVAAGHPSPLGLEARLGIAMSYEKLMQPRLALDQYQRLATNLQQYLGGIDELLDDNQLLSVDGALMQRYLQDWRSSKAFARQMERRAQLHALVWQTQDWLEKLDVYAAALQDKGRLRQAQTGHLTMERFDERLNSLSKKQQALAARLNVIKADTDTLALSSDVQRKLRGRVDKARLAWLALIAARARISADETTFVPSSTELAQADHALRLYQGMLDWDANQGWHDALWQLEKRQQQALLSVVAGRQRQARIEQLLSESTDIAPLLLQLHHRQGQLHAQLAKLKQHLQTIDDDMLSAQRTALLAQQAVSRSQLAQVHVNMGAVYDPPARAMTVMPRENQHSGHTQASVRQATPPWRNTAPAAGRGQYP